MLDWFIDLLPQLAVIVSVTVVVSFAWAFGAKYLEPLNKPLRQSESGGVIRAWPPLWWLSALFMAPMLAIALFAMVTQSWWWSLGVALFGALSTYSILYALPQSELRWDASGVEGLSSQFGFGRRRLGWDTIKKTGMSFSGVYYLQDHRGDRVYFAWTHIGHLHFWQVLFGKRADLEQNIRETLSVPTG